MLESDDSKKWLPTVDSGLFSSPLPSRSGSAPPTIEGSIAAFQAFMDQRNSTLTSSNNEFLDCESEEQMRTDPAYIAYYYANVNLNPRLPPPLISRGSRHLVQFMGGFGSKKTEGLLATHKEEPEESVSPQQSSGDPEGSFVHGKKMTTLADLKEESPSSVSADVHSTMNSSTSPVLTPSNCRNVEPEDNSSIQSNIGSDNSVVESRMKLLDVSGELLREDDQKRRDYHLRLIEENRLLPHHPSQGTAYQLPGFHSYTVPRGMFSVHQKLLPVHQSFMHSTGLVPVPVPPLYTSTAANYMNSGNLFYPSVPLPVFPTPQSAHFGGFLQDSAFPFPIDAYSKASFFKQQMEALHGGLNPYTSQVLRPSFGSPVQGQSFQQFQLDSLASRKDTVAGSSVGDKELNHLANKQNITSGTHLRFPAHSLAEPQFAVPSALPGSSVTRNINQGLGNDLSGSSQHSSKSTVAYPGWKEQRGSESSENNTNSKRQAFLELLKSFSTRMLELSDISGQIVEFSTDQHGSRFIQQKLESCGSKEKESVFEEVLPQASKLMTDVFGNYVVQKFFEHGTVEQRRKLGQKLTGQVLTLSLQMYGCRVIQKALEVIELDQKVELMKELDGNVMRCVHDQNGNHVIQKCIESVPTEKLKFIVSSFTGQVATLSCHPYGCRVIQRVLEHCSDLEISQWIVDEILDSTSALAHDPYGNYVTQHVMEMGKPYQRSQIIHKLTGRFVQLSQHKFASNVVEKCIIYGNDSERDLIIEEIITQSDNNESLLMMMKDQYANYVIQKIFEIGSEKQKDILQNCIRLHLPALKKVTYAKHIVSRYEQLAAEGSEQGKEQFVKLSDNNPSNSG
ncbi:hypothetical protein SOVF_112030 [Spinacia oleracea]|nr:hypothetical protein SOVF_112030 [Spinacia oleracea]